MLPKNKTQVRAVPLVEVHNNTPSRQRHSHTQVYRMEKLKIFAESEHPFSDFDLVPYLPRSKQIRVPRLGWAIPEGMEAANPDKFAFRIKASPGKRSTGPPLDFTDLMTEEERQLWAQREQLVAKQ